ncbi:leucine-rich repeat protein (LRR5), partial [Plasmodium malariae]
SKENLKYHKSSCLQKNMKYKMEEASSKEDESYLKLIKFSNNVEQKNNEEIEILEVCMEKSINLNIFESFVNIKELYLVKNNITDITPLFKCTKLTVLFLQINKIRSILGIEKLRRLEKLSLFNNELTEQFIKIDENKNLEYIDLSDNNIENIDFFLNTKSFTHINLANNNIKSIHSLKNNFNLHYLNISGNKFEKFEDVEALHYLKNIKELYLSSIYYNHERIGNNSRKLTVRDMDILRSIIDFKINFVEEKYKKEKYYILFINNKNVSYINETLKPFHFYYNMEEFSLNNNENMQLGSMSELKQEINFLLSAFNYIMRRLKEERNLQIKYIRTSINSYFNIFFKAINMEHEDYKKIEDLIKLNFSSESLKTYFVDNIKIENIIKVKKLSHGNLDTLIEEHLNSLIYEKNLLFLHPYNYCKINEFFEFDDKEQRTDDFEKKKFFEKNYICSCYNINHILKTLIRLFLENDMKDDLVHLIYYKNKNKENFLNIKNNIDIKKKIVRGKKFDFPVFPIYVIENYFFPDEYKEVTAYSTQNSSKATNRGKEKREVRKMEGVEVEEAEVDEMNEADEAAADEAELGNAKKKKETKFKIYYTLPKHTNLKYIINVSVLNKSKEKNCERSDTSKIRSNPIGNKGKNIKRKKDNFLNYTSKSETSTNIICPSEKIIKEDFLHFILDFDSINLFNVTKYFIKLSKVICEIRKNISSLLLSRYNKVKVLQLHDNDNKHFNENFEINTYEDLETLLKKRNNELVYSNEGGSSTEKSLFHLDGIQKGGNTTSSKCETNYMSSHNSTNDMNDSNNSGNMNNMNSLDVHNCQYNGNSLHLNNLHISKMSLKALHNNCTNLKEIYIKNNNISNLNTFFQCIEYDLDSLLYLDLSFNCISDLTPIYTKFKNLKYFNISFNYIYDYKQIMNFSVHHKHIEVLSIMNNSIYIKQTHYSSIHLLFPCIKTFNGVIITSKEKFSLSDYTFVTPRGEYYFDDDFLNTHDAWNRKMKEMEEMEEMEEIKKMNNANGANNSLDGCPPNVCKEIKSRTYQWYVNEINLSDLYVVHLNFFDFSAFKNLKILNLSNNGIVNMSNLKLPKGLKVLNLKNNKISCLDFLTDELELEKIILDNNDLKNADKICLLKNLKILRCSYNKLTNIPLLQNLHLVEINMHNNLIKDITHLVLFKYKKSVISINLYNNKINFLNLDLYLVHIFPNLLILNNSYIERKENIEKYFKNIYTLDVFFDIYNMYPPYTSLHSLEIKNLKIKNILFDINNDNFKNLKFLNISNNYLNNINNIGPLDNLKVLILNNNKHINENSFIGENDRNVLNSFESLEELDISFCILSKTSFLKKCMNLKNLKKLNLEGNNINSIKYLENLCNLKHLNLSNNKISKVCYDSFPRSLESLNVSNNLIRSGKCISGEESHRQNLSPFSILENLEMLDLRVNRIDNIEEFKYLKNLNNLKTLYLNGNRKIKEQFVIIKNMLNQIENFDDKIMKEQNSTTLQQSEEKKELNRINKETNKTNFIVTYQTRNENKFHSKNKVKTTKLQGFVKKKDSFAERVKMDSFTVIGKKANSSGNN